MSDNPIDDKSSEASGDLSRPDDELHLEGHEANLADDLSLDGPDPEPEKAEASNDPSLDAPDLSAAAADLDAPPKSQAVKDLEDHQQEGGAEAGPDSKSEGLKAKKKAKRAPAVREPGAPRGYQWFFVHLLGVLGLAAWATGAFLLDLPYRWEAALITLAVIVLTVPTMRSLHIRTRAGLAGLGAGLGMVVCSLYNGNPPFLPGFPLAIVWAFILVVGWFWLIGAIWRNQEMRKNRVCLVLTALLLYPLFAPLVAALKAFVFEGQGVDGFTMAFLNESPEFLTQTLPWFFWPQAILSFLIPFLAAMFLFKDQISSARSAEPGGKHLGNFWMGLAALVALVFSFMVMAPAAEDFPASASFIRGLWPSAAEHHKASVVSAQAAVKRAPASKPVAQAPAPDAAVSEAATSAAPLAETPAGETSPVAQTTQQAATEPVSASQAMPSSQGEAALGAPESQPESQDAEAAPTESETATVESSTASS